MPEERGLYPGMLVGEQVEYLGRLHGMSPDDAGIGDADVARATRHRRPGDEQGRGALAREPAAGAAGRRARPRARAAGARRAAGRARPHGYRRHRARPGRPGPRRLLRALLEPPARPGRGPLRAGHHHRPRPPRRVRDGGRPGQQRRSPPGRAGRGRPDGGLGRADSPASRSPRSPPARPGWSSTTTSTATSCCGRRWRRDTSPSSPSSVAGCPRCSGRRSVKIVLHPRSSSWSRSGCGSSSGNGDDSADSPSESPSACPRPRSAAVRRGFAVGRQPRQRRPRRRPRDPRARPRPHLPSRNDHHPSRRRRRHRHPEDPQQQHARRRSRSASSGRSDRRAQPGRQVQRQAEPDAGARRRRSQPSSRPRRRSARQARRRHRQRRQDRRQPARHGQQLVGHGHAWSRSWRPSSGSCTPTSRPACRSRQIEQVAKAAAGPCREPAGPTRPRASTRARR